MNHIIRGNPLKERPNIQEILLALRAAGELVEEVGYALAGTMPAPTVARLMLISAELEDISQSDRLATRDGNFDMN